MVCAKWKLSWNIYTFGANLCAHSVLFKKISAAELSRKFIESALLVGQYVSLSMSVGFAQKDAETLCPCAVGERGRRGKILVP